MNDINTLPIRTFREVLEQNALRFPHLPFIAYQGDGQDSISFAHFANLVQQFAADLAKQGISKGAIVPFQAPLCLESLVHLSAILYLDAVACPLAAHHASLVFPKQILSPASISSSDQPATIVLTSGSSGTPKAAVHSWGNHVFSALGSAQNIPLAQGDSWLLALPLYHVSGLGIFFRCLLAAATIRLKGNSSSESLHAPISTHYSFVAKQLHDFLGALPRDTSGIRHILLGGSAIPQALIQEAVAAKLPIHLSYGMTEMASQIATTTLHDAPETLFRAEATVLPYREVRIASDGEIWVHGETRFLGYLDVKTAILTQPFDENGWFPTQDLGKWTEDGRIQILGRKDNMFISGGENIQPEEIERILLQFEGITQAIVLPKPDAQWGFRPVAFLEGNFNEKALLLFMKKRLPTFKIPNQFLPFPALQQGIKVNRKALMEALEAAIGASQQNVL